MGPVVRRELIDALLQLTDPRSCLVWRRGLQAWTPAQHIPELDSLLAPYARVEARPRPPAPPPEAPVPDARRPMAARPARSRPAGRRPGPFLYAGLSAAAVIVSALAWWWARPATPVVSSPESPLNTATGDAPPPVSEVTPVPGSAVPEVALEAPADSTTPAVTGLANQEADLPPDELHKLRGVGGWAGEKLTITLYNGSSWRVTEIYVLLSRMEGDRFVDAALPQLMLPVGAPVEGAVQDLLKKVAPDRKRAGVNPADTGPFEVVIGPRPAAFRWKIERARGYAPRAGP
jgi:hypothetical protein